ncbi:unnamed protein product [Citrullus colocynthis]|uniref:Uncharacterized protein n=1 Tax=Citrullus colocynthis TaxID=252529 RepID=A0ABP0Z7E8_9ROSI
MNIASSTLYINFLLDRTGHSLLNLIVKQGLTTVKGIALCFPFPIAIAPAPYICCYRSSMLVGQAAVVNLDLMHASQNIIISSCTILEHFPPNA